MLQYQKWFAIPEACKIWLGFVNSSVYYARQTREFYQVLSYAVDYKTPTSFEIHWLRQYLVNVVLLGINIWKDHKSEK